MVNQPGEPNAIPALDQRRVREAFAKIAPHYDQAAALQIEVAHRLQQRLELIRLRPTVVVDAGCGTGLALDGLRAKYPRVTLIALDVVPAMLRQARRRGRWFRRPLCVAADAALLPLAAASCELIVSSFLLEWCNHPDQVLREFRRVLKPGGLLMFTSLGPDTLSELRQSWAMADQRLHVHPFMDMHDLGDALIRAQFADPVMDVEHLTLTYREPRALFADLKRAATGNALIQRQRSLCGKRAFAAMLDAYEALRTADGVLPASFEVTYGHAWAPPQPLATRRQDGTSAFPVEALRRASR